MSMMKTGPSPVPPVGDPDGVRSMYGDGRTKQSFADSTDIKKIIRKAQREGSLSHLSKYEGVYGDFSDVPDLLTAHARINAGQKIYNELPSEIRKEFPDQFKFFEFVNDPQNAGKLREMLPVLAEPGRQLPAVRRSAASEANPALATAEPVVETPAVPVAPDASSNT